MADDAAIDSLRSSTAIVAGNTVVLFNPQQGGVSFEMTGGRGSVTLIDCEAVLAYCKLETAKELFGCEFPEFEDESNPEETDPA